MGKLRKMIGVLLIGAFLLVNMGVMVVSAAYTSNSTWSYIDTLDTADNYIISSNSGTKLTGGTLYHGYYSSTNWDFRYLIPDGNDLKKFEFDVELINSTNAQIGVYVSADNVTYIKIPDYHIGKTASSSGQTYSKLYTYSYDYVKSGMKYLKIAVDNGALVNAGHVIYREVRMNPYVSGTSSSNDFVDQLDDMGKISSIGGGSKSSPNLNYWRSITTVNANQVSASAGVTATEKGLVGCNAIDYGRTITLIDKTLIYQFPENIASVSVDYAICYPTITKYATDLRLYLSSDNVTYVDYTPVSSVKNLSSSDFQLQTIYMKYIPKGMKYLKIVETKDGNGGNKILNVKVNYEKAATVVQDTYLTDDFSGVTKINTKSSSWNIGTATDFDGFTFDGVAIDSADKFLFGYYSDDISSPWNVIYKTPNGEDLKNFTLDTYILYTSTSHCNTTINPSEVRFYVSSDGITYTAVANDMIENSFARAYKDGVGENWAKESFSYSGINKGMKFLKIEVKQVNHFQERRLTNLSLTMTPDSTDFIDDLNDLSMLYSKGSYWGEIVDSSRSYDKDYFKLPLTENGLTEKGSGQNYTATDAKSIVYRFLNPIKDFTLTHTKCFSTQAANTSDLKFYASSDNINYSELAVGNSVTNTLLPGQEFYADFLIDNFRCNNIPTNTKYLKVTQNGNGQANDKILKFTANYVSAAITAPTYSVTSNSSDAFIDIAFNTTVDTNLIDKDHVKLLKNTSGESADYDVTQTTSGARVTLHNDFDYESGYRLLLNLGTVSDVYYFDIPKTIELTNFNLINDSYQTISSISNYAGRTAYVGGTITNYTGESRDYALYAVMYDAGNCLKKLVSYEGTIAAGGSVDLADQTIAFAIDSNAQDSWTMSAYLWDKNQSMKPMDKKKIAFEKNYATGLQVLQDAAQPVKVAFIGGSITEQAEISTRLVNKLKTAWNREVTEINAGVGGTDSRLGVFRLQKEVLEQKPDIVFVEFTVNNTSLNTSQRETSLEGLFEQLCGLDHQPLVVYWHVPGIRANYNTSRDQANQLATLYNIPVIDLNQVFVDSGYKSSDTAWSTEGAALFKDGVHPNAAGGEICATAMLNAVTALTNFGFFKAITLPTSRLTAKTYNHPDKIFARFADYNTGDWTVNSKGYLSTAKAGATLTFTFKGQKLGVAGYLGNAQGSASYTIDGVKTGTLSEYTESINGKQLAVPLYSYLELGEGMHTIAITVNTFGAGQTDFSLAYFTVDEQ